MGKKSGSCILAIIRGYKNTLRVWLWLVASLIVSPVLAQSTTTSSSSAATSPLNVSLSELLHRSFTAEEGAPVGINTMAQTPDGFLWLATRHGLFRFDGVSFVQMYQGQLPASGALKLWVDTDGSLWVGCYVNGVSRIKDGVVTNYSGHGLPSGTAYSILRRPDGKIWVATILDVAYLDGDHWVSASKHYGIPLDHPELMSLDTDGTLWITGLDKSFALTAGGKTFEVKPKQAASSSNVGLPSSFGWTTDYVTDGESLVDSSGALWLSTLDMIKRFRHPAEGRVRSEETAEIFKAKDGLTAAGISCFLEDRDGNMWVATMKGLDLFRRSRLTRLALPGEIGNPGVAPGDHGDVWISNLWQNVFHVSGPTQPVEQFSLGGSTLVASSKIENRPSLVWRDRLGSLWFAGNGIFASLRDNRVTHVQVPPELEQAGTRYQSLAIDDEGALWVTVSALGLWRFSHGAWALNGGRTDLPAGDIPLTLAFDPFRGVWLGYPGNRLILLKGDKLQNFDSRQGLRVGNPLVISQLGRQLWVGGDEGISFLSADGFHELVGLGGRRFGNTTGVAETSSGELWINGAQGVFRIPAAEVKAAQVTPSHQVTFEQFNALDGLDGASINIRPSPSIVVGTDGLVWMTTSAGVAWIDPAHIARNQHKPTPVIETITTSDRSYLPAGEVNLPKRTNAIRIDYTAPVLGMPQRAQFRYRLIGFDQSWQDAQGRRQAFYTNLPPGKYRFELQASNEDGIWSDKVVGANFDITPTFWQTPWFTLLWITAIALLLALLYAARIRRIELREWVRRNERERIARDMHDTILQGVQGLILRMHAASQFQGSNDERQRQIDAAIDSAEDALVEGRNKVMQLRGQDDKSCQFVDALSHLDAEIGMGQSSKYSVALGGKPRPLRSTVAEELYCIAKELVGNAVKHAKASHIEVFVSYGRWNLTLRVRDDGIGMDQALLSGGARVGHFGLMGMRERVRNLKGHIEFWSRTEGGTDAEVRLSAARAYAGILSARMHS